MKKEDPTDNIHDKLIENGEEASGTTINGGNSQQNESIILTDTKWAYTSRNQNQNRT